MSATCRRHNIARKNIRNVTSRHYQPRQQIISGNVCVILASVTKFVILHCRSPVFIAGEFQIVAKAQRIADVVVVVKVVRRHRATLLVVLVDLLQLISCNRQK